MIWAFRIVLVYLVVAFGAVPVVAAPFEETGLSDQPIATSDHNGVIKRAAALAEQGKLDEAEQMLREALVLTPNPALIYFELGRIHEQRGDNVKAIAAFKEGIKIHEQGRRKSR